MQRRLLGYGVILGSWGVGALIVHYSAVPLPASVVGLAVLAIGLFSGWIQLDWVDAAAQYLLRHMVLFFIPTVVGIVAYTEIIKSEYTMMTAVLILPWLGVILASAVVSQIFLRKNKSGNEGRQT